MQESGLVQPHPLEYTEQALLEGVNSHRRDEWVPTPKTSGPPEHQPRLPEQPVDGVLVRVWGAKKEDTEVL